MMTDMVDTSILEEFVIESREHLETIEEDILQLFRQGDSPDPEIVDKIFRAVHTVKGCASFLHLDKIGDLSHIMETVLSAIRGSEIRPETDVINSLLAGTDLLNKMLENVDQSNEADISEIHGRLSALFNRNDSPDKDDADPEEYLTSVRGQDTGFRLDSAVLKKIPSDHKFLFVLEYDFTELSEDNHRLGSLIRELMDVGEIIDSKIKISPDHPNKDSPDAPMIYKVLYSTTLPRNIIRDTLNISEEVIIPVDKKSISEHSSDINTDKKNDMPIDKGQNILKFRDTEMETNKAQDILKFRDPPETEAEKATDKTHHISELKETLDHAVHCLRESLEQPENAGGKLSGVFRLIRSFGEKAGRSELKDLERLSRKIETNLEYFRDPKNEYTASAGNILMERIDSLYKALSEISVSNGSEKAEDKGNSLKKESKDPFGFHSTEPHDIRVDLEKLNMLINLVGELVIAESMVTNNPDLENMELENFERSSRNLRRIISDLQDVAMSMRMIPLSKIFRKTTRLVHDLSQKKRKKIRLKLIGEDTEVDKTVIEQITDPLLHIIRNCADHGIEAPDARKAAGKPEDGLITIEAKHEAGEVIIRISDDGQGLNREKIIQKGIRMGVIKDDGESLTDHEVFGLIFTPGFSTAEKVTDVSGRGVGLDVVKKNLENLKGRVDIRSISGKGTTIILRLPLTLAIIDGMLIRVGTASYTIPLLSIRQSFRPTPDQITVTMDGQEIVMIREEMIPVVRLHELYQINPEQKSLDKGILINVAWGGKVICLFADEIIGHHQTVIKGMPNYVTSIRGVSGCTIMGNGEVSLILDVGNLIEMAENNL